MSELTLQAEFAMISDPSHYPHVEQQELFSGITDFVESAYVFSLDPRLTPSFFALDGG